MQKYIKVALRSRQLDDCDWVVCEKCWATAVDCHHIEGRLWDNYDNPYNLIWLCREDHLRIHAHNTDENKQELLSIVKKCIK